MKRIVTFSTALATCMMAATTTLAQSGLQQPYLVTPVDGSPATGAATYANDESSEELPGAPAQASFDDAAAAPAEEPAAEAEATDSFSACGCEEASCGCEPSCGCNGGCGCDDGCCLLGDCCLGDAWTLESCLDPCGECDTVIGGWISAGYYNKNERWSFTDGDGLSFNDFPDHLNNDQSWVYAERKAKGDACSAGWGYRADFMYGADAHAAQAYGNSGGTYDVTWDNGIYGWALPQLYGEVAYGDWSAKVGKWFTPVGYEVIPDTGNFFRTHTLTHWNSEPFSHTGVLGSYAASDTLTLSLGWALGWDTGFDQNQGGNCFVGGFTSNVSDDVTFTWMTTAGNLGWYTSGENGWTNHFVSIADLSENTQYVFQSDIVDTNGSSTDNTFDVHTIGVSNYLFHTLSDCWKLGGRIEWYKSNNYPFLAGPQTSFYDVSAGVNYRPHANFVLRPEIRYDWTPSSTSIDAVSPDFYNQWSFTIDGVFTF